MNLDEAYDQLWSRKLSDITTPNAQQSIDRIKWTTELFRPDACGPLLDLGCGSGGMLAYAQARGWDATGIDRSESVCAWLRDNGYDAWPLDIDGKDEVSNANYFEIVTACDVIEHLIDPAAMLRAAHATLKRRGRLYVATPNCSLWRRVVSLAEGSMFRTSGDPELRDGGHVGYYGPHDLKRDIVAAGFEDVAIHYRNHDPAPRPEMVRGPWSEYTYMIAEAVRR